MTHPRATRYSALIADEIPVRRTTPASDDAHRELVSSIRSHGLLVPLVVRQGNNGDWRVVAGNRRLAALAEKARSHVRSFRIEPRCSPWQTAVRVGWRGEHQDLRPPA